MKKWTKKEIQTLMNYVEASDDETMEQLYEYVHYMMYNEGNHPDFPNRTLSATTNKIRKICQERRNKNK